MTNPVSTAKIAGHPIHPMLIPFPVAFLVAALATDLTYWGTGDGFWAQASIWLIGAGVVMALIAALAGFTDFFGESRIRALNEAWYHMAGNLTAVVISIGNFFLRFGEGTEAGVLPWGLVMSFVVVGILLFTGWMGWEMVYRGRVAVLDSPEAPGSQRETPRPGRRAA
jgi:uncharacterized membrane protein